ncbi:MAG: 30S ribosomal protein S17 [Chloroflexi bacterium]|nr:30S ribosomal protein S17 [Chloroflexota bacterium]
MQKTAHIVRKVRVGRVVSNKMQKTVVIAVEWRQHHPLYKKAVRRITKFYAHDEGQECKIGDLVQIAETRPLSRLKRWRVTGIVARGEQVELPSAEVEAPAKETLPAPAATPPAIAPAPAEAQPEAAPVPASAEGAPSGAAATS